jgi:cardiolipin synthase A/B
MTKNAEKNHVHVFKEGKTTYIRLPIMLFIGLLLIMSTLALFLWGAKWKRDPDRLHVKTPGDLQALLPSIAGLTQANIDVGNRLEILQNGDGFFGALFRDIGAAKQSIHLEMYIWWDGALARELATLLARKAREGVEVRVLVDGSGGRKISEVEDQLTEAGVEVALFHPIRLSNLGRINNRDHRKIVVIDGRVGYIGGHGIGDEWTGNGQDKKHWRDTGFRAEGPVVNRLQAAFCENWIEETGEILAGEMYFPRPVAAGTTSTHVAYTSPSGSVSSVQLLYYLAIESARREVIIQNPYLLPEKEAIDALERAVKRGVKVMIMVPSTESTDNPVVQHASHHRFGNLLKRGVRIWEYDRTLLHQKVMIVDDTWSCVGSTNFDARSFEVNDEISVGIIDPAIAAQLKMAFGQDLRYARERHFEEWSNRGLWHKLKDGLAYLANEQL